MCSLPALHFGVKGMYINLNRQITCWDQQHRQHTETVWKDVSVQLIICEYMKCATHTMTYIGLDLAIVDKNIVLQQIWLDTQEKRVHTRTSFFHSHWDAHMRNKTTMKHWAQGARGEISTQAQPCEHISLVKQLCAHKKGGATCTGPSGNSATEWQKRPSSMQSKQELNWLTQPTMNSLQSKRVQMRVDSSNLNLQILDLWQLL